MGRNYSFDMWVPRDRLFEAFSIIARYDGTDTLAPLIWPDGRRLPTKQPSKNDTHDLIPFDGSLDIEDWFCLSLPFEEDEPLRLYNKETDWNWQQANGLYRIGCISTTVDTGIVWWNWLDEEQERVCITFTAATSSMSDLFVVSTSIQRWFVSLAHEIGAYSCLLDCEGPLTLLFLDGEKRRESIGDDDQWPHALLMRFFSRHPNSKAARKAILCAHLNENSSAHEMMEARLYLNDENSNVRARALKSLVHLDQERASWYLENASNDTDWRVRAVAAHLCGCYEVLNNVPTLEGMLKDITPEVRIAAAKSLVRYPTAFQSLNAVLLTTPATTENLGLIKAALAAIVRTPFKSQVIETLAVLLYRSDFPFKNAASKKLEELCYHTST